MRRSEQRDFPENRARDPAPEARKASTPTCDTVQVGPWDMGVAKAERHESRQGAEELARPAPRTFLRASAFFSRPPSLRWEVPARFSFEPLLSPAPRRRLSSPPGSRRRLRRRLGVRARRDVGPFACLYTSALPA